MSYRAGRDLEYEVREIFRQNGFIVTRAAGSKGPWDLIATKFTGRSRQRVYVVLLQCKRNKTMIARPADHGDAGRNLSPRQQ